MSQGKPPHGILKAKEKEKDQTAYMRRMNKLWIEIERNAQDSVGWRMLIGDLCSIAINRRK